MKNFNHLIKCLIITFVIKPLIQQQNQENIMKCFFRNVNDNAGYLFASTKKDSVSNDRLIETLPLLNISDVNTIKWEFIRVENETDTFLFKSVKYQEFLCASKYHSDLAKKSRKVIGWKLKFGSDQKIKVLPGIQVDALDMVKTEKKCLWKLKNIFYNKYMVYNLKYNEPLVSASLKSSSNKNESRNVNSWYKSNVSGSKFSWLINYIIHDFD
jgi:hypothetical protein